MSLMRSLSAPIKTLLSSTKAFFSSRETAATPPFDLRRGNGVPQASLDPIKPVACLVHIYYPEIWPELAGYVARFGPIPIDLRINVVRQAAGEAFLTQIRRDFPSAKIKVSPNRGRDIGGFFALMADLDFDAHDVICLMHTKRSPHLVFGGGVRWRRRLLDAILPSARVAAENVHAMADDHSIGAIASVHHRDQRMFRNSDLCDHYLDRLEVAAENRVCEFVAGTMMLVRSSVLRRLYEGLKDIEFEDSDALTFREHLDGQVPHAIERVIGNLIRDDGLRIVWRE